jgi:hypothetical protein
MMGGALIRPTRCVGRSARSLTHVQVRSRLVLAPALRLSRLSAPNCWYGYA